MGFYKTNLIWKDNHLFLKTNKSNSLCGLSNLVKNLTYRNQLDIYDNIIQDQIKEGIIEKVDEVCKQKIEVGEKVFYLPYRPVITESVEATKIGIMYDGSSKPSKNSALLNDCLQP